MYCPIPQKAQSPRLGYHRSWCVVAWLALVLLVFSLNGIADPVSFPEGYPKEGCIRCGFCPPEEALKIKFRRAARKGEGATFEKAQRPLFTLELRQEKAAPRRLLAGIGPDTDSILPLGESRVVTSMEIKGMGLATPAHRWDVRFDLATLAARCERMVPHGFRSFVTAYVCDDKNANGKCSDEAFLDQLTANNPSMSSEHVPAEMILEVWAGESSP